MLAAKVSKPKLAKSLVHSVLQTGSQTLTTSTSLITLIPGELHV